MSEMERWQGRVAVVTGASSGIGQAVARALAAHGLRVAMAARRLDRLEALEQELQGGRIGVGATHASPLHAHGGATLAVQADLRNERQILALFGRVREQWGGVDVLINNAGLGHRAPLVNGETELWREMLDVNLLALCICTREAVQDMQSRGVEGHIIHISSMAAHRVPPGSGVYSATKFGVRALTEALRQELREAKSPIRVTAISPGFVETEFAAIYHKSAEAARKTYTQMKVLQPEDIAAAVTYVLSQPPHVQVHDILVRPREQST